MLRRGGWVLINPHQQDVVTLLNHIPHLLQPDLFTSLQRQLLGYRQHITVHPLCAPKCQCGLLVHVNLPRLVMSVFTGQVVWPALLVGLC